MSEQKQRVYDALNKLGIKYEVVEHEPVHTMEDMDASVFLRKELCARTCFSEMQKENVIFSLPAMKMLK